VTAHATALRVFARLGGDDVPVVPDAETARGWARDELADPIYHQHESLLNQIIRWVMERLTEAQGALSSMDGGAAALVLGTAAILGVAIVLVIAGPVLRARRSRTSTEVFVDDSRTADQIRASADALAAAGRWSDAVLDRFRAILRSLEERAVLAERPGWTADEASSEAGAALPSCAEDLRRASRLFDDVCYGDARATEQDDTWLRGVDLVVRETRPVRTPAPVETLEVPR
jgi:hypothetical protein